MKCPRRLHTRLPAATTFCSTATTRCLRGVPCQRRPAGWGTHRLRGLLPQAAESRRRRMERNRQAQLLPHLALAARMPATLAVSRSLLEAVEWPVGAQTSPLAVLQPCLDLASLGLGSTALRLRVRPTLAETGRQRRASRPEDKTRRNQLPRGTLHSPPVGLFQGMGRRSRADPLPSRESHPAVVLEGRPSLRCSGWRLLLCLAMEVCVTTERGQRSPLRSLSCPPEGHPLLARRRAPMEPCP